MVRPMFHPRAEFLPFPVQGFEESALAPFGRAVDTEAMNRRRFVGADGKQIIGQHDHTVNDRMTENMNAQHMITLAWVSHPIPPRQIAEQSQFRQFWEQQDNPELSGPAYGAGKPGYP